MIPVNIPLDKLIQNALMYQITFLTLFYIIFISILM